MRNSLKLLAIALVGVLAACSAPQSGIQTGVSVSITPTNSSVSDTNRVTELSVELFTATVAGADDTRVRWTVDNPQARLVDAADNTVKLVLPSADLAPSVTLTAISIADSNAAASITLTLDEQPRQARIEFVSQPALTLSRANTTQNIEVRVFDANGDIVPNAAVTFTSSAPDIVSVIAGSSTTATVNALVRDASSAVITARYEGLEAVTNVAIAEVREGSKFVDFELIQDRTEDRVTLTTTDFTRSITVGDIIIGDSKVGLLNRVTAINNQGDQLVFDLEAASLAEAYSDLNIHARGDRINLEAQIVGDNTAIITARSARGGILDAHITKEFHCYTDHDVEIDLDIVPPSINLHKSLDFEVNLDTHWLIVEKFNMLVEAEASIDANAGSVSFDITGEVNGRCEYSLEKEISGSVHLLSLNFEASYRSSIGFEFHKSVTDASVTVVGPSAGVSTSAKFGFEYIKHQGWHKVFEKTVDGYFTPFHVSIDHGCGFAYKFTPFFEVEMDYTVTLGHWWPVEIAKSKFASFRVYASLEASQDCNEPGTCDYQGAEWNAEAGLELELSKELSASINLCLPWIGLHEHEFDISKAWSVEKSIRFGSPTITLEANPSQDNSTINFVTNLQNPFNHHHSFLHCWLDHHGHNYDLDYVVCDDNGDVYGRGTLTADEITNFDWTTTEAGTYTIYTMLPSNYGEHYYTSNRETVVIENNSTPIQ